MALALSLSAPVAAGVLAPSGMSAAASPDVL